MNPEQPANPPADKPNEPAAAPTAPEPAVPSAPPAEAAVPKPAVPPKPAAAAPAAKPPAKPPVPPKPVPKAWEVVFTPWEDELTKRIGDRFGADAKEFGAYAGQNVFAAEMSRVPEILEYLKLEEDFDYLVDVTAVDWLKREERFEIVYILYSFSRNERIRVKTRIKEGQKPQTAVGVHLTANWLEREVYDMFGIEFAGHPDLRRILMPDEWQGYPLRKDYHILTMDNRWVQENLGIESGQ